MKWKSVVMLTYAGLAMAAVAWQAESSGTQAGVSAHDFVEEHRSESKEGFFRPLTIPLPEGSDYSPQLATLGKMLFFDPRLSGGQNLSCSSCHNPSFGWEVPVPRAIGAQNIPLRRHAPTVLNAAWVTPLFWDGRAVTLEEQAIGPITAPDEMNATMAEVVARLSLVSGYVDWFEILFPDQGLTEETILSALATYQRTIVSGWSNFDRWVEGDDSTMTGAALRGFDIFIGKGGCAACHSGWNFTDNDFHRTGIAGDDPGRAGIAPEEQDALRAFKTPGLRNIAIRAPYMHDGSLDDLAAVVRLYANGGAIGSSSENDIVAFDATDQDVEDLIAFLLSLSEVDSNVPTPVLPAN